MDFSEYIKNVSSAACVVSVERLPDGDFGEVRIVVGNDEYQRQMGPGYRPNIPYYELVPKERKFEHFVFTSAFEKKQIHTYVESVSLGMWMDQIYIPLESDKENVGYCMFSFEFTNKADPDRMGNVSMETASSVIKSCAVFRTAPTFKEAVDSVLRELYEKTGSRSCVLLSVDEFNKIVKFVGSVSDESHSEEDVKNIISDIPYSVVETWKKTVSKSNCLIISNEADMKALSEKNPEWAASLRSQNVSSLCFIPLFNNQETIGYLYVAEFDTSRVREVKELIELTSFFLAAEIQSNNLMRELEHMSNIDMLTGVKNRNAMNNRVDEFVMNSKLTEAPYGIAFVDLNGLKKMNDENGHEAGDHMLWSAANTLSEVFEEYEVYRAGGDEFTVICENCGKDEFEEKIVNLREKTAYPSVITCAVGSYYASKGEDIRYSMHEADQEMYRDKESFYKAHPEMKVRQD